MAADMNSVGASLSSVVTDVKSGQPAARVASSSSADKVDKTNLSLAQTNAEVTDENASAETTQSKLEDIKNQVQSLQDMSQVKGWSVNFSVDSESDETVIKVVDADTQKVIRQIPSEEMLSISQKIKSIQDGGDTGSDLSGLLFDRKA